MRRFLSVFVRSASAAASAPSGRSAGETTGEASSRPPNSLSSGRGEARLQRSAAADDVDVGERRGADGRGRRRVDVAVGELGRRLRQDARDVERHVAVAHHHRGAGSGDERRQVLRARHGVVPVDEPRRVDHAGAVLPRNPEAARRLRAEREDHDVVEPRQVLVAHRLSQRHVADEADRVLLQDAVEEADDVLGALMVRRDARAHEAERRRQPVDDVDPARHALPQEGVGGVEPGGPGADDGDGERGRGHRAPRAGGANAGGASAGCRKKHRWSVGLTCAALPGQLAGGAELPGAARESRVARGTGSRPRRPVYTEAPVPPVRSAWTRCKPSSPC